MNNKEKIMQTIRQTLQIPEAPLLPGLTFRNFRGESDFPAMIRVIDATKTVDQYEGSETVEDLARSYSHLTNCDPYQDVLIAEMNGEMVAHSRVTWWIEEANGNYFYTSFGFVDPPWRRKGIGQAMLRHNQRRLRKIASTHPMEPAKSYESFCSDFQKDTLTLLENAGYQIVRRGYSMVRPDLEAIPDLALPDGLEVRPVQSDQHRMIWDAFAEAFLDHWGYSKPQEEDYRNWVESPEFQPDLWQIAWDGDQVAGMILNFIDHIQNQAYNRKRGYTEGIAVRRPWRRRGLARTLLARSLKMHRDLGMTEAALGVDATNLSGANILYESMGFRVYKIHFTLRKPMGE